jgi:hypothetical protein
VQHNLQPLGQLMLCEEFEGNETYLNSDLVNYLLIQQPNDQSRDDN